jgi:hypothetical protein
VKQSVSALWSRALRWNSGLITSTFFSPLNLFLVQTHLTSYPTLTTDMSPVNWVAAAAQETPEITLLGTDVVTLPDLDAEPAISRQFPSLELMVYSLTNNTPTSAKLRLNLSSTASPSMTRPKP